MPDPFNFSDAAQQNTRPSRRDPARQYVFSVYSRAFGNVGSFSKVSGISEEIEVVEKRDGSQPFIPRKLVGQFRGGAATLEKGLISDIDVFSKWFNTVKELTQGNNYRSSIIIGVAGNDGLLAREIVLSKAWPSSYKLGDLDAKSSGVAVESLTIVFESLEFRSKYVGTDASNLPREFNLGRLP